MKFLLIWVLSSLPAQAALKFAMERSTALGTDKVELDNGQGQWIVHKTSNWFDRAHDLRLGRFTTQSSPLLNEITKEMVEVLATLEMADQRLREAGRSFNELNGNNSPHEPFFRVNNFKVLKKSDLYPRLETLAMKLQQLPLSLISGVELDKERKNYIFYEEGKETKREAFNARFFCEDTRFPTRCLAREWGALYLQ